MIEYPLPNKIVNILSAKDSSGNLVNPCENFGLLFSRLLESLRYYEEKEKYNFWQNLVNLSKKIYDTPKMKDSLEHLHKRLDYLESSYAKLGFKGFEPAFRLKVDWRLVVGLGNPSVLDTGLRLHSIYGFPYLPGSSLKGAVRNAWINKKAENLGIPRLTPEKIAEKDGKTPWKAFENLLISAKRESNASNDKFMQLKNEVGIQNLNFEIFIQKYVLKYQALFGNANEQGSVSFLDALPINLIFEEDSITKSILEVDIINPHYGPYYTGNAPPADWHSPKPIFFLPFRFNTPFRFRVLAKNKQLLREVKTLFTFTAKNYGLGAKTMSGYGEMYQDDE